MAATATHIAPPPPLKRVTKTGIWGELTWQTEPVRQAPPPPPPPPPVLRQRVVPAPPRRPTRPPIVRTPRLSIIEEEVVRPPTPPPRPPRLERRRPPPAPPAVQQQQQQQQQLPPATPPSVRPSHVVGHPRPRLVTLKRRDREPPHRPLPKPPALAVDPHADAERYTPPPLVHDDTPPRTSSPASSDGSPQTPPTPTLPNLWFRPPPLDEPDAPRPVDEDDWGLGAHFALLKSG
ncbi:Filamentous hemagglutinin [Vanrija pseudolonga]|uniref:Filamentous hemagglutinin n=1 Tax=Vanrija pseudolonga TaxID=143232 RepID=A0AAF0Y4K7_9TREE|nr:Filamentous hemagglutinin [Vanrija pseudolonga]